MSNMNRRDFLKGAALGALGLTTLGVGAIAEEKGIYTPGTYSATANGMGKVTVTMTFDANAITAVTVDTSNETQGIASHLGEQFAEMLLAAQGAEIDGISGATITSSAVMTAAKACIEQAKGEAVAVNNEAAVEEALDEKAAYEAAVAPIAPAEAPEKWDYEADVVIVGSGAGGMNAALRLRENGLSCIVLEKLGLTGGTSRCAGYFVNAGGHRQANEMQWAWPEFPYNVDKVVEKLNMEFNQLTSDPELLRAMVEEGPKCIDWMVDDLDIDFVPFGGIPAGCFALYERNSVTKTNHININNELFDRLTQMVKDAGAEIHTATAAKALVMKDGAVVGVKCGKDGAEVFYHGTKAVFLMAGGFEMNRAMLRKYLPFVTDGIANCACPPYNYGEVVRMGQGCGADMSGYGSAASYDGGVWWREYGEYETELESHVNKDGNQVVRQPWLRINQMGQRVPYGYYWGDMYPYRTSGSMLGYGLTDTAAIDGTQPGGGTYVCFDSKYEQLMLENYFGEAVCRPGKIVDPEDTLVARVPEFQRDWRTGFNAMVEAGAIKKCDTIEELEEALGLRKGVLTGNVEKWNAACEKGEDWVANYKYDPKSLVPINEPPYYGAKIGAHIFTTKCGLRINSQMQVIDKKGAVIPGLYAGWHTAGGANGEFNIAGRPWQGLYGDLGQSYVGGFMAANALVKKLNEEA